MTSATNPSRPARAFTLIELLVVIGILVLLVGILFPAINRAWKSAVRAQTQSALHTISVALDQYKADWGAYPPVPTPNAGAAVLCKALLGPYDAAHYYSGAPGSEATSDTLQNPPPAYDAAKTYQAGDVVLSGTAPTFDQFMQGSQAGVFVCTRTDTQANGTAHAPSGTYTDFYWSLFLPYDAADGPGGKLRLGAMADANGVPHAGAGATVGPYLNAEQFKLSNTTGVGAALLDRYGSPILYFPFNKASRPLKPAGASTRLPELTYYQIPAPIGTDPTKYPVYAVDSINNLGPFIREGGTAETYAAALDRIGVMLGDYNADGWIDESAEPAAPNVPFLLWTAGPDRQFGPAGRVVTAATDWRSGDVVYPGTGAEVQNRKSVAACDDVTNFRD